MPQRLLPKGRWRVRVRRGLRWVKAQWRRRFPTQVPAWTGPVAGTPSLSAVFDYREDGVRITVESVGRLRRRLATTPSPASVRQLELVVEDWRAPWPGWSGRLGPLPGLLRHEVCLPQRGTGRVTVRVALAAPVSLDRMVAAVLPVLEPWCPLPTPVRADVAGDDAAPVWLRVETSRGRPVDIGPKGKAVRAHDVRLAATDAGACRPVKAEGRGAIVTGSRYGVTRPDGMMAVVVDATTANPRGRQRYGPDLPVGRLRLVAESDGVWWHIARGPGDPTLVVAGRVGDPLDERQRDALARLRGVEAADFPADTPPAAAAAAIAQLAMTGVVLHAPGLTDATAGLLAPEVAAFARKPLPGRDADPLEWELRGVAQRRAALRHHATAFAWPQALADTYPALGDPPTVSALLVSKRPHLVMAAVAALAAQTYPALEVVVGLHGGDLPAADRAQLAEQKVPVQVVPVPARLNLGEALAEVTRRASGSLITKVDDDDRYGPEHVWDLVLARHYAGATVAGKGAEFVHLESRDLTVRRYMGSELYTDVVAGGAMLLSRGDLEEIGGWRPVPRSVDRALLDRVLHAGGLVYRTHGFGFIYTRHEHGHTWDPGVDYFLHDPRSAWRGLPSYEEFGVA